jgi:hypothetical protein
MWATPGQINTQVYEFQPEQNRIKYLKAKTEMCQGQKKKLFQIVPVNETPRPSTNDNSKHYNS